ncbi:MAG: Internalin-A [Verrucomicrobia subdivision 3 bacterium]|nr:Internalin-A [Limisphaerales bacterium]MCS1415656.1 Internalin-A [Limisphaerales bacterium]
MKTYMKSLAEHLPLPTAAAMKPGRPLLAIFCLAALSLTARAQQADEVSVTFVRENGRSETRHYPKDSTRLDWREQGLTSITLSSGWTNLKRLNLSNNQLWNLTLPEGLTSLRTLFLSGNGLWSLTLPEDLTSLETLDLGGNNLRSLTLPEGLRSLAQLDLSGNRLWGLTLPEGLTNLRTLDISHNAASSVKGRYPDEFFFSGNGLTGLTLPEDLTSLETLRLEGNLIKELLVPQGFDLSQLTLSGLSKDDVTYYDPAGEQVFVTIEGHVVEGLRTLYYPKAATQLILAGLELNSVTFSKGWTNLKVLNLAGNDLEWGLTLPEDMTSLQWLHLAGSDLGSLTLPEGLTSLEWLNLGDNDLTSLTLPEGLTSLRGLEIGDNELVSLTIPEDMTGLGRLYLRNNPIVALRLPRGFPRLDEIYFRGFFKDGVTYYDPAPVSPPTVEPPPVPVPPTVEPPAELEFMLQWADSVEGPWTRATRATITEGVVRLPNEGGKRFFRLVPAGGD